MSSSDLGKVYADGEIIVREGDQGDCMYVIQQGMVEIIVDHEGRPIRLATRQEGEFFGEMALFERATRMATVRALGEARILTVDKRNLLRRISEDPALAFRMIEVMSHRIRELSLEVAMYKGHSNQTLL